MKIGYKPKFVKQFKNLEPLLQEEVLETVNLLKNKDNHQKIKVHKLKGKLSNFYSCSVNYNYRIVFVYEKESIVCLCVGDHSVYK